MADLENTVQAKSSGEAAGRESLEASEKSAQAGWSPDSGRSVAADQTKPALKTENLDSYTQLLLKNIPNVSLSILELGESTAKSFDDTILQRMQNGAKHSLDPFNISSSDETAAIKKGDIDKALLAAPNTQEQAFLTSLRLFSGQIAKLYPEGNSEMTVADLKKFLALSQLEREGSDDVDNKDSKLVNDFDETMKTILAVLETPVHQGLFSPDKANPVVPDAVNQSFVGSCYLAASLRALAASEPKLIEKMITDKGNGEFEVRFPGAPDNPQLVKLPSSLEQNMLNVGDKGTWPAILTQAYAQMRLADPKQRAFFGISDDTLLKADGADGGRPEDVLFLLTGRQAESIDLDVVEAKYLRESLKRAFENGKSSPIVASTLANDLPPQSKDTEIETTPDGLDRNHALTVVDFKPEGPEGGTVLLRDPRFGASTQSMSFEKFAKNISGITRLTSQSEHSCTADLQKIVDEKISSELEKIPGKELSAEQVAALKELSDKLGLKAKSCLEGKLEN